MNDDKLIAARAALSAPAAPRVGSFWRNVKTDTVYMVCGGCILDATVEAAVAYRNQTGDVWVGPLAQFADGRFVPTADPDEIEKAVERA